MKKNQLAALKKLEAALLSCKRASLVLAGVDNNLHATVNDEAFRIASVTRSRCEAILERGNSGSELHHYVKHYGCYSDSGGA